MKKLSILFIIFCFITSLNAQTLLDVYKKGVIDLIPDTDYAKNTNWNKLFDDRNDTTYGNPVGKMKSIAITDNGEVFVGNYSKYNIYKFDKNGNFLKEFGKEGSKNGDFLYRPTLHGILDNKYVFASDHQGRILFFDLNGNFYKMVKIDYMPLQIIPLKDNKIAIWGHVPYNGNTRYIVSIKDIDTGKEIIVDSYFNSLSNIKPIAIKLKDGGMVGFSPRGVTDKTIIERTFDGNLIVGHNVESKLSIFSPQGKKIKEISLNQSALKTRDEDKIIYINNIKSYLIKKNLYEENKELLNDPNIYPKYSPIYYAIKSDPEGNTLVFNYSEKEGNSFLVFDKSGQYVCSSDIKSEQLKLDINSRFSTFEIHSSGLFAFVTVINSKTSEMKVIKIKLK